MGNVAVSSGRPVTSPPQSRRVSSLLQTLSLERFLDMVEESSALATALRDAVGALLKFERVPRIQSRELLRMSWKWKRDAIVVLVHVATSVPTTAPADTVRVASVREFLFIHLTLLDAWAALETQDRWRASLAVSARERRDRECCICLDRAADRVLPGCAHSMCGACFAQWAQERSTCPLCRSELSGSRERDLWVLTDGVEQGEEAQVDADMEIAKLAAFVVDDLSTWGEFLVSEESAPAPAPMSEPGAAARQERAVQSWLSQRRQRLDNTRAAFDMTASTYGPLLLESAPVGAGGAWCRCPACKAVVEMPESGLYFTCGSCRNMLQRPLTA